MAALSDYSCSTCRSQHRDLKALLDSQPGSIALLILPTPLDSTCNPHVQTNLAAKTGESCGVARMALALWKTAPEAFPAFHDYLMKAELPLSVPAARKELARIAPQVTLDVEEEWITTRIQGNITVWHGLSPETSKLPKLILGDDFVLHGTTSSREKFFEVIQQHFPKPSPGIPVSTLNH